MNQMYRQQLVQDYVDIENEKNYGNCPECGGNLIKKTAKQGPFLSCSNYPNCKYAKNLSTDGKTHGTYPKCGGKLLKRNSKCGPFLGCDNFPDCKYAKNLSVDGKTHGTCPDVGVNY